MFLHELCEKNPHRTQSDEEGNKGEIWYISNEKRLTANNESRRALRHEGQPFLNVSKLAKRTLNRPTLFWYSSGRYDNCASRERRTKGYELSETLLNEKHELLFPFVGHFHVLDELAELNRAILSQQERFTGLGQKVDEVTVVAWANVRQARVGCVNVGGDCSVQ